MFVKTTILYHFSPQMTVYMSKEASVYLIYLKQWSIEVFFKFTKQNLGLGKCHLSSHTG